MAFAGRVQKETLDPVSQNKIFCETVHKELRCQRLQTEYAMNPFLKGKKGGGGCGIVPPVGGTLHMGG